MIDIRAELAVMISPAKLYAADPNHTQEGFNKILTKLLQWAEEAATLSRSNMREDFANEQESIERVEIIRLRIMEAQVFAKGL